jgi:aquaporin Z
VPHWPEYVIEAGGLGAFLLSACAFAALLEHPAARVAHALPSPLARRALMGLAMGITAVALIYSPLGKRSGAHLNPAVTATFYALGRVQPLDALGFVLAQFAGGALVMLAVRRFARGVVGHPTVNFVVTQPGRLGKAVAWLAEAAISCVLMSVVLASSSNPRSEHYTGLLAGLCIALFITFEAPLSGMSMNPARTFASAVAARDARALWIYLTAPLVGMLLAALVHTSTLAAHARGCAKLRHDDAQACCFCGATGTSPPASNQSTPVPSRTTTP